MLTNRLGAGIALAALLAGCTSYRGADRISNYYGPNANGTLVESSKRESATAARVFGLRTMFEEDFADAWRLRKQADNSAAVRRMIDSGLALVEANCTEYFHQMGRNQRNSAILRDLIAPITSVINTVINLQLLSNLEKTNQDISTGFTTLSAIGTSALDIYDRRFLFDSDNISAVQANTMAALGKNRDGIWASVPKQIGFAINRLQENEQICMPAQILNNVRGSIKGGKFENEKPDEEPKDKPKEKPEAGDQNGGKETVDETGSNAPPGSSPIQTTPE